MKKILITGGSGFIGSNLINYLIKKNYKICNIDKLSEVSTPEKFKVLINKRNYKFYKANLLNKNKVKNIFYKFKPDFIINFAAESHVDRSIVDPDTFVRTNCLGTNVMCDVARHADIERFLHISTDEVYGSIEEGSFVETDRLGPRSPYSSSKAGSDLIALSYQETYDLPVIVTRSSNNFGPYQFPEKVIPLFVTNLLDGKKVPLYGDGLNVRDWIHVLDNCAGVDTVLRKGTIGEIYNIGGGNETTNRELTTMVLANMGVGEEMVEYVQDRLGHDRRYSIDCSKANALGWQPSRELDVAIAETVEWYRANRSWWEPLKA